jgi:hypothetical protein
MGWKWFHRLFGGVPAEEAERRAYAAKEQGQREAIEAMENISDPRAAEQIRAIVVEARRTELELAYRKGKEEGIQETKAKFRVVVEPFKSEESSLFSKRITAGYQIEYFFEGFRLGEPFKVTRYDSETMDMANLGIALAGITQVVRAISSQGLTAELVGHTRFSLVAGCD